MMAITGLSKQSKRKRPEEKLRNALINIMTEELGFPSSSVLVEKSLSSLSCLLPHSSRKLPLRRVDIAVTTPCPSQGLSLLLIVECKVDEHFESALSQVQGYRHHLACPFVWIASEKRSCILFWNPNPTDGTADGMKEGYAPFEGTPTYANLLAMLKILKRDPQ